ncbi:MAG TPA: S24 family peptidase [Thermoanaerobaculia bacterium]|nr:S24 family peptidase [Thermoanaerobaculia bacterium]
MLTLGERIDAAIRASGKTAQEIAKTLSVNKNTISRLRTGKEDNPKLQLLRGIARVTGTTIAALLGISFAIAPEDADELARFRGWIDRKLATMDALSEPNARILPRPALAATRDKRVADRPVKTPFGDATDLLLHAIGESMIGEGILPDDMLYAVTVSASEAPPVGKLIVCRIGEGVFVKRLVVQSNGRYLLSAHPRYQPIALDDQNLPVEILGVIIGRSGRTR